MPSRRRTKSLPEAEAAVNCDGDIDMPRDRGGDGDRNDADSSTYPQRSKIYLWDEVQHSLCDQLIPLISHPEKLLTTVLLSDNSDEHNNVVADAESNSSDAIRTIPTKQQLLMTSQQLFRYIEYLASMEEKLKELQKQQNTTKTDEDGGEAAKKEEEDEEIEEEPCSLSGLSFLYTGNQIKNIPEDATCVVDTETVWGQVDLQNQVLISLLKKMIKKLSKRSAATNNGDDEDHDEKVIRLLYTGSMQEDSDEDDDEEEMSLGSGASDYELKDNDGEENENDYDSDEDIDGETNEDRRRIRDRMEKAMADMSDDEEDNIDGIDDDYDDDDNIIELTSKSSSRKVQAMDDSDTDMDTNQEEIVDPTREDLRDGFFDLHEMEAFADEEEEMLPDDAYGEEDPDAASGAVKKGNAKKTEILHHVRDRLGMDSEDDDDDVETDEGDDNDANVDDPLSKRFQPTGVRRKKYRADDEVEALYKIYEGVDDDDEASKDSENDNVVDASTMTAADFFGQPNKKLIQKYKTKKGEEAKIKGKQKIISHKKNDRFHSEAFVDDDDNDSWDNHNFEEEGLDWKENGKVNEENPESDTDQIASGREEARVDDDDIIHDEQKLSSHAKQLRKLKEQTISIEQDMMSEKPWKMMGEAKGTDRATDSLLESTPEFEVAFKPPPILTPEHAANIEEMIKKRIIDEDWDDVVPRELPDIGGHKRGGDAPEVSQEKSKLGLGELYEREYLKKTAGFDRDAHEKQTDEDAAKEEMKQLFANLCSQLDALSNYHFAPRPIADAADVQSRENVPAIAMEEVLPLHVSQSRGVAPEEVYAAGKGRKSVLKGESELDQGERKSVRNAKKAARRKARKQKHADERLISKLQPGLGLNNPYEKRKLREELQMARASGKVVVASDNKGEWKDDAAAGKEYQTSAKFFAKMQENVETMLRDDGKGEEGAKKKRKGLEAGQGSSVYRL